MELRFKPDVEDALAHWRAFWNHDIIKRPCVAIRAPKDGVERVITAKLCDHEQKALKASADTLRGVLEKINI